MSRLAEAVGWLNAAANMASDAVEGVSGDEEHYAMVELLEAAREVVAAWPNG
jgi:hypothetical protein